MTGIFDDDSYDEWDIIAKYYYDDRGFRIKKKVGTLCTYYVRDLSGNILSIYTGNETTALQKEVAVYGSGRLGTAAVDAQGEFIESYLYELTDHLGNVRATLKDNYNGNGLLNSYADYYPGGMPMPGVERTKVASSAYKFGYQGQFAEKDDETGFNQFEARLYDARIMRWNVPDPAGQFWSPYLAMGNSPVSLFDPDGRLVPWYVDEINGELAWFREGVISDDNSKWKKLGGDDFFGAESFAEVQQWLKAGHNGHWFGIEGGDRYAKKHGFQRAPTELLSINIQYFSYSSDGQLSNTQDYWQKQTYVSNDFKVFVDNHSPEFDYWIVPKKYGTLIVTYGPSLFDDKTKYNVGDFFNGLFDSNVSSCLFPNKFPYPKNDPLGIY